jgi:ABC-2 type transport system permease protein
MAGLVITVLGALLSGLGTVFTLSNMLYVSLMILATSLAFNTMMFLMMVRVEDPLVPRATFGILNTLLFFPSGAIYPIKAFPTWLRWIAYIDPFTYSVHGFKALLLKDAGFVAIRMDLLYLTVSAFLMITLATALFKRTL